MKTQASVDINRPVESVFDFTMNHVAEWSDIVVEDEVLEQTEDGVGTTFRVVTEEKGRRMEFHGTTTAYEPLKRSACVMVGPYFDIHADYRFEDLGNGRTRVTQDSEVIGKGFTKVMFFLIGWAMKKKGCDGQKDELNNLKKILESSQGRATG